MPKKKRDSIHLILPGQVLAQNTRERVLDKRRQSFFPYESEQTKKLRDLADAEVFKSSGNLISGLHSVGAVINTLSNGFDPSALTEIFRFLPSNIPLRQANGYNRFIPLLKLGAKQVDFLQSFDNIKKADSLYRSADSIDNSIFKNGGNNQMGKKKSFLYSGSKPVIDNTGIAGSTPFVPTVSNFNATPENLKPLVLASFYDKPVKKINLDNTVFKHRPEQFYQDWMSSPMANQMMSPLSDRDRNKLLSGVSNKLHLNETGDLRLVSNRVMGVAPGFKPLLGNVFLRSGMDSLTKMSVSQHELSHGYDENGRLIPDFYNKYIRTRAMLFPGNPKAPDYPGKIKDPQYTKYIQEPTETRARLMEIRLRSKDSGIYDPFTQKADPSMINEFKKMPAFQQLQYGFKDDDIIDLLNTIAKTNTPKTEPAMAMNGIDMGKFLRSAGLYDQSFYRSPYQEQKSILPSLGNLNLGMEKTERFQNELPFLSAGSFAFDALTGDYSGVRNKPGMGWFDDVKDFVGNRRNRFGIYDTITGIANANNDANNRAEEMRKLAELMQKPDFENQNRYGLDSRPMFYQNGGSYVVKKGDTLSKIAKQQGLSVLDIVRENGLDNPDVILPGQVLYFNNRSNKAVVDSPKNLPPFPLPKQTKSASNSSSAFSKLEPKNPLLDQLRAATGNNRVIMSYAQQMMLNGNPLFLTDKGTKTLYYQDEKGNLQMPKVITGVNDEKNRTRFMTPEEVKNIPVSKGQEWRNIYRSQITPLGATGIEYFNNYNGHPAIQAKSPSHRNVFWHAVAPEIQARREKRIATPTLSDNTGTNGCINCDRDVLGMFRNMFQSGNFPDSAYVIDSRLSPEQNKKAFEFNKGIKPGDFRNGGNGVLPLPKNHPAANAIVESEEAVEFSDGRIGVVPAQGPGIADHDDPEKGTYLSEVNRVLEDTSAKNRRNSDSDKALFLTPDDVENLTGFRPKTGTSHAGAYEKAEEFYREKARKVDDINRKYEDMKNLNPAQRKALELNNLFAAQMPSNTNIFDNLFQHQENVKATFDIENGEAKMFKNGGSPEVKAKNAFDRALIKYRKNPTLENKAEVDRTRIEYVKTSKPSGYQDFLKSIAYKDLGNIRKMGFKDKNGNINLKGPVVRKGVDSHKNPFAEFGSDGNYLSLDPSGLSIYHYLDNGTQYKSSVFDRIDGSSNSNRNNSNSKSASNKSDGLIRQTQYSDPLINSNWGLFQPSVDANGNTFLPPFTEENKPAFYDNNDEYWTNIYDHARSQMGMPGFNHVSAMTPHAQYQSFMSQQYGPLVIDAFRNKRMHLTNKHLDLAAKAGKTTDELTDQEILDGFVDDGYVMNDQPIDGKKVRGISVVPVSDPQAMTEIPKTYRPVNFNGKTLYVENAPANEEQPVVYYDLQGNPVQETPTPASTESGAKAESKTSTGSNAIANVKTLPRNKNRVPLEWFDLLGPMSGLVNAMGRYPEMPFKADVETINLGRINPQQALNNVFSQSRTAMRDVGNDSVGQAVKAGISANTNRAIAEIIANAENTNVQIKNQEQQYNAQARDKQSLMDATAAQDFHNRVLQSRSRQDENIVESLDKMGKLFASNRMFNRVLNMLDTKNYGYDPENENIGFTGGNTAINPATFDVDQPYNLFARTQPKTASSSNTGKGKMSNAELQKMMALYAMAGMNTGTNNPNYNMFANMLAMANGQ